MWKILVVDDNFSNRKLILKILEGRAICDVAANGEEALEAYNISIKDNKPYDLILLDIQMPDVDGMQVLQKIREEEKTAGVKVGKEIQIIMVTAHREPFFDAFKKGCDDYINKPIRPDMLIERIEKRLNK
ncbi:MAG: response regulator [Candidatus Aureabacteria bacterium]|nr:response regulator [Candidatus Auribacterota bacterium]